MHSSRSKIVEIVMGQNDTTDKNSNDSAHLKSFSNHIAENTKQIGDGNLCDFIID
jgi:hypothetical protein